MAGVGLGDERGEAGALGGEPLARAVGGGAVDDDDLGVDLVLFPDAREGGVEAGAGVFADQNDAEDRCGGGGGHEGEGARRRAVNAQRAMFNAQRLMADFAAEGGVFYRGGCGFDR